MEARHLALALARFALAVVTAVASGRAAVSLVNRDLDGSDHFENKWI